MIGVAHVVLSLMAIGPSGSPSSPPPSCEAADPVPLARVWSEAADLEPGYRAVAETVIGRNANRSAARRGWAPGLAMAGLENWGQRLSPSEERALGVGFRGELRLVGDWTVLDAARRARVREGDMLLAEARIAGLAFDLSFRAEVARLYVDAAAAEALVEARLAQRDGLRILSDPVRRRLQAGVDARWEGHLLDEAVARAERLLAEVEQDRAAGRAALSALVGRCVRPASLDPRPEEVTGPAELAGNPELERLRRLADAGDAAADVARNADRLALGFTGAAGPVRSRVFVEEGYRMEYLLGVTARWTPDLTGERGRRADAEDAFARGARARAESQERALDRELRELAAEMERAGERGTSLEQEAQRAERTLAAALARWREGVGHWTDIIGARERAHQARQEQILLDRDVARALIRYEEVRGDLGAVPTLLGQGSSP